jgi:hypothetical protein
MVVLVLVLELPLRLLEGGGDDDAARSSLAAEVPSAVGPY